MMPRLIHSRRSLHVPSVPRCNCSHPTLGQERQYRPPPGRRDSRMSVAVDRRTVSLWPSNASPVSTGLRPREAALVGQNTETEGAATEALAAITSSYRHGRAGIISGDSSSSAAELGEGSPADLALPTHPPTVPLTFWSGHTRPAVPQGVPAGPDREVATFWSRLLRPRRPASRGRHSLKC